MKNKKSKPLTKEQRMVKDLQGKVLTGLSKGDKVMYHGEEHTFLEYRDYGFTCIIKPKKGKEFLVFGSQIKRLLHYPPYLNEEQKKKLKKFLDVFLRFKKYKTWVEFQEKSGEAFHGIEMDKACMDFMLYHFCTFVASNHKNFTRIIDKG